MRHFQITFKDRDIFAYRGLPRGHIKYGHLYEVLEVIRWRGITEKYYESLSAWDKARLHAHYRAHNQIEAITAFENVKKARRRSKSR